MRCPPSAHILNLSFPRSAGARGFTVIELLVVVGVIAMLVALLMPSLSEARDMSIEHQGHVNLRSTHGMFTLYTMDNKEFWPYATKPVDQETEIPYGGRSHPSEYFGMTSRWKYALADAYYDENPASPSVHWPVSYNDRPPVTFIYSGTFLASHRYWTIEHRVGPRQWRATRVADVLHPVDKGLIAFKDFWIGPGKSRNGDIDYVIAFVDGHVERFNRAELGDFHPGGDGPEDWAGGTTNANPFEHTLGGVRGRDRAPERVGGTTTSAAVRR